MIKHEKKIDPFFQKKHLWNEKEEKILRILFL